MNNIWILAQAPGNEAPFDVVGTPVKEQGKTGTLVPSDSNTPTTARERPKPLFPLWLFLPLMLVLVFMLFRGPQKQKQQRKQLMQSLAKNDRVQTIGGIIGTIVDIKADEITLKVDESNNTKIKVVSSAIGKNLSKE